MRSLYFLLKGDLEISHIYKESSSSQRQTDSNMARILKPNVRLWCLRILWQLYHQLSNQMVLLTSLIPSFTLTDGITYLALVPTYQRIWDKAKVSTVTQPKTVRQGPEIEPFSGEKPSHKLAGDSTWHSIAYSM